MSSTLVIKAISPTEGLVLGIDHLLKDGGRVETRNGPAWTYDGTVVTEYTHPHTRVLFAAGRDANPFFHIAEAAWMLCGRNDIKLLANLAKNMANYSVDGVTQHAAYGHRWSHHFGFDQLAVIIDKLRSSPQTRQAVLQIWDATADLADTEENSKDRACNLSCVFMPRINKEGFTSLDMMVSNRSNDIVWGAYGANAVHFSFLHHLVAELSGFAVGVYRQVSDNYHMYSQALYGPKLFGSLVDPDSNVIREDISYLKETDLGSLSCLNEYVLRGKGFLHTWFGDVDLVSVRTDLFRILGLYEEICRPTVGQQCGSGGANPYSNLLRAECSNAKYPALRVIATMLLAHSLYKTGDKEGALRVLEESDRNFDTELLGFLGFEGDDSELPPGVTLQYSPCKVDWFHAAHTWIQRRL